MWYFFETCLVSDQLLRCSPAYLDCVLRRMFSYSPIPDKEKQLEMIVNFFPRLHSIC